MSTKSTIFHSPYCHIYKDRADRHNDNHRLIPDGVEDVLVVDVSYGFIDYEDYADQSSIVAEWDSDFAFFIRLLISLIDEDEVNAMVREHWLSKNPQLRNK